MEGRSLMATSEQDGGSLRSLGTKSHPGGGASAGGALARRTIELIGPPASGKTTLAVAAAAEFRRHGIPVRLLVSARPGEMPAHGPAVRERRSQGRFPAAGRVAKLGELLLGKSRRDRVAGELLALLPLGGGLSELRRRRYLASLAAHGGEGLMLRDQGYLCAIAGLAVDAGRTDEAVIAEALRLVPVPDLTVRVGVAPGVALARLEERLSRQGRAARLLERPPDENTALATVFDTIESLLERSGSRVLRVSGEGPAGLEAAVSAIVSANLEGPGEAGAGQGAG